jgi:hypothetical protein
MQIQTIANVKAAPTRAAPMPTPTLNLVVAVGPFFFGVQLEVGGAFEPVPVAGGPGGQLSVVVVVDELEGALVKLVSWVDDDDGIVVAVLVRALPVTPIIVWAFPLSIEKVPLPVLQSQLPFATSGPQHQLRFPHEINCPRLYWDWRFKQALPQIELSHCGFVHDPRIVAPIEAPEGYLLRSVTTQIPPEKHVQPMGQQTEV